MLHECWKFISPYLEPIVLLGFIFFLFIAVITLSIALLKKESAMLFKEFTFGTGGVNAKYEMSLDEKMKQLIAENVLLKKEVDLLRKRYSMFSSSMIVLIIALTVLMVWWRFTHLFKLKKQPLKEIPNLLESMPTTEFLINEKEEKNDKK